MVRVDDLEGLSYHYKGVRYVLHTRVRTGCSACCFLHSGCEAASEWLLRTCQRQCTNSFGNGHYHHFKQAPDQCEEIDI